MQHPYNLLIFIISILFFSGCGFQLSSIHYDGIYADERKPSTSKNLEKDPPFTNNDRASSEYDYRFQNPFPPSFSWSYFDYGFNLSFLNYPPHLFSMPYYSWNGFTHYHLSNASHWWMHYPYPAHDIYNNPYRVPNRIYQESVSKGHSLNYRGYNDYYKVQYNQDRVGADNNISRPTYHNKYIKRSDSPYQTREYQSRNTQKSSYSQPVRSSNSRSWSRSEKKSTSTGGRGRR